MAQADTLAAKLADAAVAMTSPVADDAVCVMFLLSRGDVRRVHAVTSAHLCRSPKIQSLMRGQARLIALLGVLFLVGGLGFLLTRPAGAVEAVSLGLAAVFFWIAWRLGRRPRHAVAVARAIARFDKQHYPEYSYQQTTLIFDRSGYRGLLRDSASVVGWGLIASVEIDEELVMVSHHNGTMVALPVRAFASVDAMRAAGAKLIAWLDESGHGDANRLRRYLREKPTACPFCEAALNAETLRCPGCDEPVTRYLLPEVGADLAPNPPTVPGRVEV